MNEMKETKILKNSEVAQPDSQTEQIIDKLTENSIETLNQALAKKDKIIDESRAEIIYWRGKAQQLASNNKKCLICLVNELEVIITKTCRKCERLLLDWEIQRKKHNLPADDFWKQEALKRWEAIGKEPVILFDEYEKDNSKLTKISGILTSQIRTRQSSDTPFMAFVRLEYNEHLDRYWSCKNKHGLLECIAEKCQECETPVIFRISNSKCCQGSDGSGHLGSGVRWLKPKLKKGDSVILEGKFSPSENSNRPSFTCYSFEIL